MAPHVARKKGHYRGGGAPEGNQKGQSGRHWKAAGLRSSPLSPPRSSSRCGRQARIDLAQAFQVTPWCICAWKRKHPEFRAACEVTDEEKLAAVKRSLFHRATGYSHPAKKIMAVPMGGGVSEIVEVPYVEHYPPDTAAIRYYLNNRAPSEWRERSETGAPGGEIVVRVVGGLPNDESDAIRDGDHEGG